MLRKSPLILALMSAMAVSAVAFADPPAQDAAPPVPTGWDPEAAAKTEPAPATAPASDPAPATATAAAPATATAAAPAAEEPAAAEPAAKQSPVSLVEGAGKGGKVGYARKGVLELGGSAGLTVATNMRDVNFSPSIGWFIANNLEMSAILGVSHIRTEMESSTLITALVEPSYHMQFAPNVFGLIGIGVGGSYVKGLGGGFAVAPRLGANVMVGRSGVLTPSLSWQYTTHSVDAAGNNDTSMLAVSSALRINVGYTVMW
jgi:hypothetical protein